MSVDHYENFPVASWLCPPELRPAVVAIYHYARTADDLADEGDAPTEERDAALRRYRDALLAAADGRTTDWPQVFGPLARVIERHQLPLSPLLDLLDAFRQDVHNPVYPNRRELLDYCRRSANPVGRLLLHLWGLHDERSQHESDAICTALQLINFWQDFSIDHPRGRCYVPLEDAQAHGVSLEDLMQSPDTPVTQALVADLCRWAAELMTRGKGLALRVPGRSGWELRLVVQGGLRILEKIGAMDHRSLHRRPRLQAHDAPVLMWRALRMGAR